MAQDVARTGYQNFGSFFSDNVEDLIAIPKDSYRAPQLPFTPPSLENVATLDFGEPCRQLFMIDFKKWTFVNHGAFGAVCLPAHQESNQWREHCEAQPLLFLDRELFPHMVRVMREMADFIGADPRELVFVPNATTGLNVAIQAAGLRPGDTMYMLNIGYGSVKKMAQAASAAAAGKGAGTCGAAGGGSGGDAGASSTGEAPGGIDVVYGEVTFPISGPQDIVDLVARTMPPATRLAVFDSVTSNTALVLPVQELTRLCHSRGVQVLIDGAHALGQLPLDLRNGVCGGTFGACSSAGEDGDGDGDGDGGPGCAAGGGGPAAAAAAADAAARAVTLPGPEDGAADASDKTAAAAADAAEAVAAAAGARANPDGADGEGAAGGCETAGGAGGGAAAAAAAAGGAAAADEAEDEGPAGPSGSAEVRPGCGGAAAGPAAGPAEDGPSARPDYFVSNCHKWLCAPRGSAVLWVAPRRQACVRPLVVSHGSGCGFTSDFIWDGCRDYAPYLATSSALALWRALGPQRVRAYCRGLLAEAVALLSGRWGTRLLAPSLEMCGFMALVELPRGLAESEVATSTDAKYIQDLLHHVHAVECPVKCIQGRLYVRISAHVYNTLDDYRRLADAVERITQQLGAAAADPRAAP